MIGPGRPWQGKSTVVLDAKHLILKVVATPIWRSLHKSNAGGVEGVREVGKVGEVGKGIQVVDTSAA